MEKLKVNNPITKSFIAGNITGIVSILVAALCFWLANCNCYLLLPIIFVCVALNSSVLFYNYIFNSNKDKKNNGERDSIK